MLGNIELKALRILHRSDIIPTRLYVHVLLISCDCEFRKPCTQLRNILYCSPKHREACCWVGQLQTTCCRSRDAAPSFKDFMPRMSGTIDQCDIDVSRVRPVDRAACAMAFGVDRNRVTISNRRKWCDSAFRVRKSRIARLPSWETACQG
jgi:hypothetical protein